MVIASYNMQNNRKSRDNWRAILHEIKPDLLLAQESLDPESYPDLCEGSICWQAIRGKWGSAIFSRSEKLAILPLPEFQGWVVGAELEWPEIVGTPPARVRVFSIHAPNKGQTYQQSVSQIIEMIASHRNGCELVVGGDFNLTISERHHSEVRSTSEEDRKIQKRLQDELGLVNCWQSTNADKPLAQTLRWDRDPVLPYHCDGIFVSLKIAERLVSCDVLAGDGWTALSDHNPIVATFR
jgi:exonuclease III